LIELLFAFDVLDVNVVVAFDVVAFDVVAFDVVAFDVVAFDVVAFDVVAFDVVVAVMISFRGDVIDSFFCYSVESEIRERAK